MNCYQTVENQLSNTWTTSFFFVRLLDTRTCEKMKKIFSLLLLVIVTISGGLIAQTGPAGVGSSTNTIIWLDPHAMGLADGASISSATDFSGNGNHFGQTSGTSQPVFDADGLNGLPVMAFDGVDDFLEGTSISNLEGTDLTYFIVYERVNLKNQMLIDSKYASEAQKWRTYCNAPNNRLITAHYSPSIQFVRFTAGNTASFMSAHITSSNSRVYELGSLQQNKNVTYTAPTTHETTYLGAIIPPFPEYTGNYNLDGFIAEVIVMNSSVSDLERIMIENYLGAKYGLAIATDRYAWEATHNIELIGIGNDGTSSQTTAQGKGVLEISAPTAMTSSAATSWSAA